MKRIVRGRTILTPTGCERHGYELELVLTRSSELYLPSCTVQPLKEDHPPLTAALCHRTMYLSAIQAVMSLGVIVLGIRKRIVYKNEYNSMGLVTP